MNYKFQVGDTIECVSIMGSRPLGTIQCRYTSDKENHPAHSHNRYVVLVEYWNKEAVKIVKDWSESELKLIENYEVGV